MGIHTPIYGQSPKTGFVAKLVFEIISHVDQWSLPNRC